MTGSFAIASTNKKLPALVAGVPFTKMKQAVLGSRYDLSLSFIGDVRMRKLNREYRKKDATTDVLSFEIDTNLGEIFISLKEATKRAGAFQMTPRAYIAFLFIHGMLHLKGHDHGRNMDALEKKYCGQFKIPLTK